MICRGQNGQNDKITKFYKSKLVQKAFIALFLCSFILSFPLAPQICLFLIGSKLLCCLIIG